MATPATPTFLKSTSAEQANTPAARQPGNNSPQKRSALRWILPTVGILVLLAGIAAGVYFVRHRGHRAGVGAATASSRSSSAEELKKSVAPRAIIDLPLDPFVVNLADAGGHGYARIGLTLHLATPAAPEKGTSAENDTRADDLRDMVRDRIIGVLNRQQSANLLAPNGKKLLKEAIVAAIQAKSPQLRVIDIYFTQFLVQS